ncbi:hypothetical protein JKF63_01740 [Porcisia hertigi]|uniref:Uncharacterized protein n=1 Tax=Porcisia hertigi TaxID=2761500 RepID=A0A836I5I1_9TRYP|nr:hypothetical protein JKF63_01740 [Porcisia hertigi]
MGACCARGESLSSTPSKSSSPGVQGKKRNTAKMIPDLPNKSVVKTATAEEMRARARRQAMQALVGSIRAGEPTIPTMKWRRQYIKTPGIGPATVSVIANHIQGLPMVLPSPKLTDAPRPGMRPLHRIRTLDIRALHAGDDGFVEMMSALLDDTLIEKAIFSGNDITDDGIRGIISRISSYKGIPAVDDDTSATGTASTAAGNGLQRCLPCKLKHLVLTDNTITSDGIASFSAIAPFFAHLEQLEVGRGQSGGGGDVDDVRDTLSTKNIATIAAYIQRSTKLETFLYKGNGNYYARNGFTPDGLVTFVDATVGDSSLKELYLHDCFTTKSDMVGPVTMQAPRGSKAASTDEFGDPWAPEVLQRPMQSLSRALTAVSSNLNTLSLRFPLSDDAVQILCTGIAQAPKLLNLSLRDCDLSSRALSLIGDALRKNKALCFLDVSYQSYAIAHPALLEELRSSSKRKMSLIPTVGYLAAEAMRQDLRSGNPEILSCEEREHALLPIIRSLHTNRTLSRLVMLGLDISTDDLEELCACIERSDNHTLAQVWYTRAGNDALDMKLEDLLVSNRKRSADGRSAACGGALGHSSVCSTPRSVGLKASRPSSRLLPDASVCSDSSDSQAKPTAELDSNEHPRTTSASDGPLHISLPTRLHLPQKGNTLIKSEGRGMKNGMTSDSPSPPTNMQPVAKTGLAETNSSASASQVMVSMISNGIGASAEQLVAMQHLNSVDESLFTPRSADMEDDACTIAYSSHTNRWGGRGLNMQ